MMCDWDPSNDSIHFSTPLHRKGRPEANESRERVTASDHAKKSLQNVKDQKALLEEFNHELWEVIELHERHTKGSSEATKSRLISRWPIVQRKLSDLQKKLVSYRTGKGKRYHLNNGFVLNLPFAYMSRQFPRDVTGPARDAQFSSGMRSVDDPTSVKARNGLTHLKHLLQAPVNYTRFRPDHQKAEWIKDHGGSMPKWVLTSERLRDCDLDASENQKDDESTDSEVDYDNLTGDSE